MKFLKVFINSLLCGTLFSLLLALLIMDININTPFNLTYLLKLTAFLALTYGLVICLFWMIAFFIIQFFVGRKIGIKIISPSFLSFGFSFVIFLYLLLFQINISYFRSFFSLETSRLVQTQFITLIFMGVIGLLIFYGFQSHKRSPVFYISYFFLLFSTIFYSVNQRVNFPVPLEQPKVANLEAKPIDQKITIIGMEGMSFEFIIPLINEGKLRNFAWLMENGAWGNLENYSPSEMLLLTRSFNTGKLPSKHRQLSPFKYQVLKFEPALEVAPRFLFFRQLTHAGLLTILPNSPPSFTKDIWTIFKENGTSYLVEDQPFHEYIEHFDPEAERAFNLSFQELRNETSGIFNRARTAFLNDCTREIAVLNQINKSHPRLTYFMLNGLNIVETYFYKYSFPDLFGNQQQEDVYKYHTVIERYYEYYDQIIGKYLASHKEDDVLIVYSPHGIEPLSLWKRFVEWILGNPDISASHDNAPDGMVFFYGKEIAKGKNIENMKLIDIAPTLLYYLGLNVGLDMDGVTKTSIFSESFRAENPIPYISSYDKIDIKLPE